MNKTRITILIAFLLVVIFLLLLFSIMTCIKPGNKIIEKHSDFDKNKFLILLFPVQGSDLCGRAIIVSITEYESDFIKIYKDDMEFVMPKGDFTIIPSVYDYDDYVDSLNKELIRWGEETDWTNIEYNYTSMHQEIRAVLTIKYKDGMVQKYSYSIVGTSVQPVSIITVPNIAKKMTD